VRDNDAILSADQRYRYVLSRHVSALAGDKPICLWVMVNPSTADASTDDHTIRKVSGYCRRWGFARFRVVNLWAYRSKDVGSLSALSALDQPDPIDIIGPDNDRNIREQAVFASEIIVAWGSRQKMPPSAKTRIPYVLGLLRGAMLGVIPRRAPIFCIGRTKGGDPLHPLTTPYSAPRERFDD
jgi:hypothetical protein